jgi:hypothetical protein
MSHTFSRHELFDLVWSEPTRTIAKRLGISDVGLAKVAGGRTCCCRPEGIGRSLRRARQSESRSYRRVVLACPTGLSWVGTVGVGDLIPSTSQRLTLPCRRSMKRSSLLPRVCEPRSVSSPDARP